ncbi:MAG: hypothetical protein AMJ62_15575 [Myxococcales bacterium SG8_38]|nr:MAG: hypothetical protein AMJ62_15575 [Myxococcales bacterium SG8_38]
MGSPGRHEDPIATSRNPTSWTAFVATLSVAVIIDNAPFPRTVWDAWITGSAIRDPAEVLARAGWVLVAVFTLLRPSSMLRYAVLCLAGTAVIISRLPTVPNHWILELGVFVGSLATLATARDRKQAINGVQVLVWGSILAVYAWTFVHKLNWGFLDPEVSCGAVFLESLGDRLGLPPPTRTLRVSAVFAVLVCEGAMPILLLGSRLRAVAVLLGLGLHLMFGLFVPAFSLFMWATYFLLLPADSLEPAFASLARSRAWLARQTRQRFSSVGLPRGINRAVIVLLLASAILAIKDIPTFRSLNQQETVFLPLAAAIGALVISALRACRMHLSIARPPLRVSAVAALFSILLLLNGAVPYLGARNTLAFSMFSNLRTENGQSNHLFLPSLETSLSVLHDQIEVLESSDPVLDSYARPQNRILWNWTALIPRSRKAELQLPLFMVRYRAQELRDAGQPMFSIRLSQEGGVRALSAREVGSLPPVDTLAGWLHWSKGTPLPPHRDACMW